MSFKLNVSSGSYNVHESELYKDYRHPGKLMRCRVHFLDDSEGNFELDVWQCFLRFQLSLSIFFVAVLMLCLICRGGITVNTSYYRSGDYWFQGISRSPPLSRFWSGV